MASSLIRRRLSPFGFSENVEACWLHIEWKLGYSLRQWACSRQFSNPSGAAKLDWTDLTRPHTGYPNGQRKKRNVILHVGPTNNGKIYQALKRLESSSLGTFS